MTDYMNHGDEPNFVERPKGRKGASIPYSQQERMLASPIEFAQNMGRTVQMGMLQDLFAFRTAGQVDDARQEFEYKVETAIDRGDRDAIRDAFVKYTEFVIFATDDAHEMGMAIGAIMEQLRVGLTDIFDLLNRGLDSGDVSMKRDLQELHRKHKLPHTFSYQFTDLAKSKEDPAT